MSSEFLKEEEWLSTVKSYFEHDYRERGKVKWNGFFLSDHTAKLKEKERLAANQEKAEWLEELPLDVITDRVNQAKEFLQPIRLQENQLNKDGQIPLPKEGAVSDFHREGFYLGDEKINWESIRFVEVLHGKRN
ncbi:hypothetical protein G6R29_00975 [Fructobacillus sp. M2-14]|uniref:DNA-directed RNA polymerase beta subunit n=1 Tax=Fructobacillus broussonetiae TaxID=2713173 RepID=A0ABS5R0R7_9LACO|nr:hypothetical protein [Fructobacillus broussonetiae]MBS9338206.1 hypothetical protein [Fructobacillus broussonetiae]